MPLSDKLRAQIRQHGPMAFRDFMRAALYDPEDGYYSGGKAQIGRTGDFYTSVSVGPIFARLLARQFSQMWELLGKPAEFVIVEQGAHGGDFALDCLRALREQSPDCFETLRYGIVEPSEALQRRQSEHLQEFIDRVSWYSDVEALPSITGVHFSNELLDAFPVLRVRRDIDSWSEEYVAVVGDEFVSEWKPLPQEHEPLTGALPDLAEGYVAELNPAAGEWIHSVSKRLARGWILILDYGHSRTEMFRPDRKGGTLTGYASHQRVENLLATPGQNDLTSHVDFTAVASAALEAGLDIAGYTDQHHFMVGLSQLHFTDRTEALTADQEKELRGFKTLMHPNLMGLSFKALCLSRPPGLGKLAGFAFAREPRKELELTSDA